MKCQKPAHQKLEPWYQRSSLLEPEGLLEWGLDLLPRAIRLPRARLVRRPAKLLASSRVLSLVGQHLTSTLGGCRVKQRRAPSNSNAF